MKKNQTTEQRARKGTIKVKSSRVSRLEQRLPTCHCKAVEPPLTRGMVSCFSGCPEKGITGKYLPVLLKPHLGKLSSPLKSSSAKPEAHLQSSGSRKEGGIYTFLETSFS